MALHYPALANIVGCGLAVINMLSARRSIRFCLHCSVGLLGIVYQIPAAAMQKEIHVVGDRSFNPYEFCTFFSNKAQGILVDQWRLMAKRNSIHITYTCDDWQAAQD